MWNVALIFVAKSSGEFQNLLEVILRMHFLSRYFG